MLVKRKFISQRTTYLIVFVTMATGDWQRTAFATGCSSSVKDVAGCVHFHGRSATLMGL